MRRPIIAANWKMNMTASEARRFVRDFLPRLTPGSGGPEVVIAPPATALAALAEDLAGQEGVQLGAQNVHAEPRGAFTGEISAQMLADLGCSYCIVGHSERRTLYAETSAEVSRKAAALLRAGLAPIVCVGETLEQRERDRTFAVVSAQVAESLSEIPTDQAARMVLAYEPVWAIGSGRTATPENAQQVHCFIRQQLKQRFGAEAERIRIQYGGSVKPENAPAIMAQPDIDGALVGGASLDPESLARIVAFDRPREAEEKTTS